MIKLPLRIESGMTVDADGRWITIEGMKEIIRLVNATPELKQACHDLISTSVLGRPSDIAKARERGLAAIEAAGGLA